MKALHSISFILLIVGGLNWLAVGALNWNVNQILGGPDSMVTKIVYVLVGLSAIFLIFDHKQTCKLCTSGGQHTM